MSKKIVLALGLAAVAGVAPADAQEITQSIVAALKPGTPMPCAEVPVTAPGAEQCSYQPMQPEASPPLSGDDYNLSGQTTDIEYALFVATSYPGRWGIASDDTTLVPRLTALIRSRREAIRFGAPHITKSIDTVAFESGGKTCIAFSRPGSPSSNRLAWRSLMRGYVCPRDGQEISEENALKFVSLITVKE